MPRFRVQLLHEASHRSSRQMTFAMPLLVIPIERYLRADLRQPQYEDGTSAALKAKMNIILRKPFEEAPFFVGTSWREARQPAPFVHPLAWTEHFRTDLFGANGLARVLNSSAIDLITFIRHSLAHGAVAYLDAEGTGTAGQAFKSYVRSHGSPLNTFWKNGRTNVHRIDFRTLHSIKLVPDLAFGIMNLLRVSVQHIDHMIAETLSVTDVVRWTVLQIRAVPQARQLALDRLSSKVQKRLKMEWGIDESLGAVLNSVRVVTSDA
jgi:hypothetical protein